MSLTPIFIGIVTTLRPDWQQRVAAVTHDRRLTAPDKIAENLAERRQEQGRAALLWPAAATVTEVCVARGDDEYVATLESDPAGPAVRLSQWLQTGASPAYLVADTPCIFGIAIRDRLRVAAVEAAAAGVHMPAALWCRPQFSPVIAADPYELLVKKDQGVTREGLHAHFNLMRPASESLLECNAREQVEHCRALALAAGLA